MRTITPYKGITLNFDEGRHRFTRIIGGISAPVISVTGVTSVIDKSRQLMSWQERITKERLLERLNSGMDITEKVILEAVALHRAEKAKAGTVGDTVHEFAEHWSLGLKPEIPEEPAARNGALAFLKFMDESGMKLSNPEEIVYSKKHNYAGIKDTDGVAKRKLYALDYKTSKGIYLEMRYQVAAYRAAKEEMTKKKYDGTWILRFDKESGDFEPLFIERAESEKDFNAFLGALAIRQREKQLQKDAKDS